MISAPLTSRLSIKPEIENRNCENQSLLKFKIILMSIKPLPKNNLPVVKTSEVDLLDLLFQNRNKEYGAYQLRKLYNRYMTRGGLLTIALSVLLAAMPSLAKLVKAAFPQNDTLNTVVNVSPPPEMETTVPPPVPPPVEPLPARPTLTFLTPKVIEDEKVLEEALPPTVDEMQNVDISTKTQDGVEGGIPEGIGEAPTEEEVPPAVEVEKPMEDKIFVIVEQRPVFEGGDDALSKYLGKNLLYPAFARENGIEGTVVIQFVVNTDGSIVNTNILRDIGGGCGEEALRVVRGMPKWLPGKQRGKPVRVQFNLPFRFKLQE
jgi:protein TonB